MFDFLRGLNSTNLARSAGAPMAANQPGAIMARAPYRGLGATSTPAMRQFVPQQQAPSGLPPQMMRAMLQPRFPRIQSLSQRINQLVNDPLKVGLIASSLGARPGEMMQVVAQYEDARARREAVRRQFEEIEQQKREAEEISEYIKSLASPQGDEPPSLNGRDANFLSKFARINPQAAMSMVPGLLEPEAQPELSDVGKKARELSESLGRELTNAEKLELYGLGPDATDDDLDKRLSTSDLEAYRTADGEKLPAGSTLRDAINARALPFTATEISQQRAQESATVTLDELEELSIGDDGVHINAGGGPITNMWPGRVMHGASNATGTFFGTEASQKRDLYNRMREAFIASVARSKGESGSLSDADIARIVQALPDLGATPMTEEQARKQWAIVRRIYGSAGNPNGTNRSGPTSSGGGGVRFLGYEK